jgi:NDP-sugar pyrophosphorylase family protein
MPDDHLDGMILAAGLATRLRPLTDAVPKALLPAGGVTLLERTLERLVRAGCDRVVVNCHHQAEAITSFLNSHTETPGYGEEEERTFSWMGAEILVSHEEEAPLETGGGLKRARHMLRRDRTLLLHNVDVISDIDLAGLAGAHAASGAMATLAVNRREATRYLVFDDDGLCGRVDTRTGAEEWARLPGAGSWRAGFTGIHALSPSFLAAIDEEGAFSIMQPYLRLATAGESILPHDVTGSMWLDAGTPERLAAARAFLSASPDGS